MKRVWNVMQAVCIGMCLSLLGMAGCGGGSSGGSGSTTGELSVSMIDAATDEYKAVYVTIAEVAVHLETEAEAEAEAESEDASDDSADDVAKAEVDDAADDASDDASDDSADDEWKIVATPNKTVNLLELVNGVREELGLAELAAGHYTQMRLIIGETADSEANILGESHPFANYVIDSADEVHELKVPSGLKSGIKIVKGFDIGEDDTTDLILDFDAAKSVVVAGKGKKYLLKPTIKVLEAEESATIAGLIINAGDESALGGAMVSVQTYDAAAADPKDRVMTDAATFSADDGAYSLLVAGGAYNLVAFKSGFMPAASALSVAAGETLSQDIALEAAAEGNVVGAVSIADGDAESSVAISFRQSVTIGDAEVMIEVASVNVVNGESYSVPLPIGAYKAVSSADGHVTQEADVTVEEGLDTTLDIVF